MINYSGITNIISDMESEAAILKTVVENTVGKNETFVPMLVFYSNRDTKDIVIAPAQTADFNSKMLSIAETLHLYHTINAYAVTVVLTSKMMHDDTSYDALTISVLTDEAAWNIVLPYIINGNEISWQDKIAYLSEVDDETLDETGRDIYSMFYMFTHLQSSPFTSAEVLSYLSFKGAAIHQLNSKIEYFSPKNEE